MQMFNCQSFQYVPYMYVQLRHMRDLAWRPRAQNTVHMQFIAAVMDKKKREAERSRRNRLKAKAELEILKAELDKYKAFYYFAHKENKELVARFERSYFNPEPDLAMWLHKLYKKV